MFIPYGIVVLEGIEAKIHRRTITPVFSPKSIRNYLSIIDIKMSSFLKRFDSRLSDEKIDMIHVISDYTFETVLVSFFENDTIDEEERMKCINAAYM